MQRLFSLVCVFCYKTSPSGRFRHYHRDSNQLSSMTNSSGLELWGCIWGPKTKSVYIFGAISLSIISSLWWCLTAAAYRTLTNKKNEPSFSPIYELWKCSGSLNVSGICSAAVSGESSDYRSRFLCVPVCCQAHRHGNVSGKCVDISRTVGNIEWKKIIQTKNRCLLPHPNNPALILRRLILSPNVFQLSWFTLAALSASAV